MRKSQLRAIPPTSAGKRWMQHRTRGGGAGAPSFPVPWVGLRLKDPDHWALMVVHPTPAHLFLSTSVLRADFSGLCLCWCTD